MNKEIVITIIITIIAMIIVICFAKGKIEINIRSIPFEINIKKRNR
ncbi:hypothetical protein ACAG39_01755 [Caldicellulosiruptoraceae bacterium PP1]